MKYRRLALLFLLGTGASAWAQWNPSFTADLGRGYGSIALSQSVLSGMRANSQAATGGTAAGTAGAAPSSTVGSGPTPGTPRDAPGGSAAVGSPIGGGARSGGSVPNDGLSYVPEQAVSDRMREEVINSLGRTMPQLRTQMEQSFAGNAVLKEFEHHMSSRGYSSRNVADDMAELLVSSWEITTGGAAQGAQVQGAHRQVRDIFLGNSRLRAMTNTERQEMAERIAYQVVISSLAHREYLRRGDRVQLAQLQRMVTTTLRQQGIDLTNLRLTAQGFHR